MTFKLIDPVPGRTNASRARMHQWIGGRVTCDFVEVQRGDSPALVTAHELGHVRRQHVGGHLCPEECRANLVQEAEAWRVGLADYRRANGGLSRKDKRVIRKYFRTYVRHLASSRRRMAWGAR